MLSLAKRRAARAHKAGEQAEQTVDATAQRCGWKRVAANYRTRSGELDRVYIGAGCLVVVEVRYRGRSDYGHAAETVTAAKQRRITRATQVFLLQQPEYSNYPVRFDVVGMDAHGSLDWIEAAFTGG